MACIFKHLKFKRKSISFCNQLKIDNGFETQTAANGHANADKKTYLRSGCGAVISYRTPGGDISEITKAALTLCPIIFEVSSFKNEIDIFVLVSKYCMYSTCNAFFVSLDIDL